MFLDYRESFQIGIGCYRIYIKLEIRWKFGLDTFFHSNPGYFKTCLGSFRLPLLFSFHPDGGKPASTTVSYFRQNLTFMHFCYRSVVLPFLNVYAKYCIFLKANYYGQTIRGNILA